MVRIEGIVSFLRFHVLPITAKIIEPYAGNQLPYHHNRTQEKKMRPGEKPSKSSEKLADMIHKAIADCEITGSEYDAIMKVANEDQHIDRQEQNLLNQLQSLMANGTIKRVKG